MSISNSQNDRITYEHEYDQHIMDLKLKIIYPFLINARVLDVGCGETKGVYRRVGRVIREYIGIDKDIQTEEKAENYHFCQKMMCDFKSNEKFDVILLFGTLEEVPNMEQHLKETIAVMKDDGHIFISVPNPYALNRVMGACNGFIESPESLDIHDMHQGHLRLPTVEQITHLANNCNLLVKQVWPIGFKPVPMSEMSNLKKYWHQFDMMMQNGAKYGIDKFAAGFLLHLIKKK
jgi:2-polyprenyl-3-methyl-5-hydroxy-6-metoxy-1,4-benzoquinol methylase